jgi:serine/threonine protein kinase
MSRDKPIDDRLRRLQQAISPTYTLQRQIGQGGMAQVLLAIDNRLGGQVAIKLLDEELARDPRIVKRFVQEARTQSQLNHPNIVPVFGIEEKGDLHFFFMPFIDGEDLEERMRRPMQAREAVEIALQIAGALQCAHAAGVVHRDLKPSNVRLRSGPVMAPVMVMDFGIARVRAVKAQVSSAGLSLGTPAWMSPEQWTAGEPAAKEVDGRTDLYSLGVILYEMLAKHNPFFGVDSRDTKRLHLTHTPPPLSELIPYVNTALSNAVERLLKKDPVDRFQTASELTSALKDVLYDLDSSVNQNKTKEFVPHPPISRTIDDIFREDVKPPVSSTAHESLTSIIGKRAPTDFFSATVIRQSAVGNAIGIQETFKFYRDHLDAEYRALLRQALWTFRLWITSLIIGLLTLTTGVILVFRGKITEGTLGTLIGAVIYFIQRIFQQREDHYREEADAKHKHLEYGNHWLMVIQSIEVVGDPKERTRQYSRLIDALREKIQK